MKKLTVLLLLLIAIFSVCACGNVENADTSSKSSNSTEQTGKVIPTYKDMYLLTEDSSFLEVQLLEIGKIYKTRIVEPYGNVIMLKFKVLDDFYQKIEKNTEVTVPISLDYFDTESKKQETFSKDEIKEFFSQNDNYLLYVSKINGEFSYYNFDSNEVEKVQKVSNNIFLKSLSAVPINNENQVNINDLIVFLEQKKIVEKGDFIIKHYLESNFLTDGLQIDRARENIKNLYAEFNVK